MKLSEIDAILEKNNPQEEEPREEHAGKLESALVNFGNGILGWLGSTAQGAGMQLKDLQRSTRANNPNDNPNLYDGVFSNAGDILLNEGQYWSKLSDAVSQSDKYRYDAEKFGGRSVPDLVTDLDFWTNAGGAWTAIPSMAGSSYMPMVASMAIPGGALTKGAGALTGPVSSLLGKAGLSKMSQALASRGVAEGLGRAAGFAGVSAPMDALANTSEIIEPLREKGFSDEEIAAIQRAAIAYELPIDLATEFVTGGLMSGVPGRFAGKQFRNLTGRNIPKFIQRTLGSGAAAVAEPISEDVQETYQTITTDKFSGKPYGTLSNPLPEESEAGTQGFLGSLPMSVIESLMGLKPYGRLARMRYNRWQRGGRNANASEESGAPDSAAETAPSLLGERPWQERYEEDEWDNPQGEDAIRGTNVLGEVGRFGNSYNMPTQGDDITEQVATLKAGWRETLPQIGGILKNRFGVNAEISSAGRSEEHNAEVGGAENSYHIVRENGGDAVDIVLPDNTPQETLDAIEAYFKSTGAFDEVLFHDVGSGNHLHLGGLHGGMSGQSMRTPPNSVDAFMSAIMGQESGGNYDARNVDSGAAGAFQIMPENWPAWAENAGLSADAPMTPENQNYVARQKMQEYYNQFGNWRDVAIAWYAGPEAVNWSEEAKNRPQDGYPSVNEYADSVLARMGETSVHDLSNSSIGRYAYDRYFQLGNEIKDGNTDNAGDFDYFGGIVGEIEETGTLSDETRQELEDRYGDDILKNVASKATNHIINQQTTQEAPRTFQTGPSQNQAPIQRNAIETPNLETLQAAQRYGFAGGMNQDLTKQPAVSRLFPTGPNDANNKAAQQQAQAVNNAVQAGQYNPDLTRNTVNDIVQQIARQEAARQQTQAAPNQNILALLPMLPPGQSQQQAQPTIQTPTGGQMAATTADAIAGQQQAAPVSFLQQPQPAGLQQLIQQIMERGNQNAQNQNGGAAPAPEVYQAGNDQNSNVEPQTGTATGIADQQEGEINSFLISSFENRISAIEENFDNGNITEKEALAAIRELSAEADKTLPENERKIVKVALTEAARRIKAKAKARQKEESASVLDQPAPMGRDGETYRQFADRMAESGARLDSRNGKNTIMYGDFGDFSVPQEVADYFTSVKNGQAKSAQKSDAQGGEHQANETDRGETIAPEEKAAQNGSNEAMEEIEEKTGPLTLEGGREAYNAFKWTIVRQEGRDAFDRTMKREMDYNGVKETRRAHIERIFREHPEWEASQMIRKAGTKDVYGFKQTDYMIYHGENVGTDYKKYPFEYITRAEKRYLDFLHGEADSIVENRAFVPNENFESFADVIKEGQKRDAEIAAYRAAHPEAEEWPDYIVEKRIEEETAQEQSAQTEEPPDEIVSKMPQASKENEPRNTKFTDKFESAINQEAVEEIAGSKKQKRSSAKTNTSVMLYRSEIEGLKRDLRDGKKTQPEVEARLDEISKAVTDDMVRTNTKGINKLNDLLLDIKAYKDELVDTAIGKKKANQPNEKQDDFHGFLSSKEAKVASEANVRSYLSKQMEVWDDAAQSHKKITMAEYIENFTKTPGAEFTVKMPDNNGLAGESPHLVYQNDEMKKRNYAPTLDPIGFAYGRYLMQNQPKATNEVREKSVSLENANEKFMEDASVTNSPNVQPYKERAEGVIEAWQAGELRRSEARDFLKEIMSGANRDRYEKGLTRDEMLAAQGFADDALRIINNDDVNRYKKNKAQKRESAPEQTSQKEIQDTTFTFGGKEKINQYETAYTVNMDKAPSKDAVRAMLEGYNNVKVSGKTLTFYNKDAADKFLSDMEKTYGSKVVRQADKYNGFLKNMSPMQQAKADKTLSNPTRYEGQTMTNGELIEKLVAEGREPKEKAGKRGAEYRLYKEDGTFIDLTKTEYDYAKYLTEKKESGQETENTPVKETAKEGAENGEEQEQNGSADGGHEVERAGESEADERSGAGEVSGRDGREGTRVHGSAGEENSGGPRSAGVRTGTELEEATGNGTDAGRDQSDVSLTEAQAHPSPEETPGHDFEIKESAAGKTNEKIRFKQNIEAIRLLKKLEEENRMPTPAEQEVLGAYNGWGGLKKIFLDEKAKENKELRELLTDEEYNAAKSTMNDAFYTPPKIIRAIWEGVSRLGFKGGRILEPSLGIGNFFGCMPRDMMKHSDMRGIERDGLTSRIAKQLYPNAYVETKEFQKAKVADNYFDLVISNIPFGDKKVDGYHIHNYFFASGMDKVRPGGLMVFITSQGTLIGGEDAAKMRRYLDGKADMIAAYKLPSGTFSEAGTDVATDVVIFQKRGENGQKSKYAQPFIGVTEKTEQTGAYSWQKKKLYDINEYFESHPENIIGDAKEGTDQYGNPALEVKKRKGETVDEGLAKAMQSLPENIYQPLKRGNKKPFDTTAANKRARADEKTRDLAYYERDGKIYQNQNGEEAPVTSKKAEVVKDYLGVKNALDTLYIAESDPKATDKQLDSLRKMLNKSYDTFVKKHGRLNNPVTAKNFIDDPSAGMVQALEKVKYEGTGKNRKIKKVEKADVFTQRTVQPVQEVKSADTPSDALLASLSNKGTVDLDYMADLLKTTKENVIGGLTGKIFQNPVTEEYETREEYLSGNVREKLAQAETAAKKNPAYQKNVEELKKVIPEDLVSSEILVNMGAPWIPVSDVQDFITSIQGYGELTAKFSPLLAKWEVDGYGGNPKYNTKGIQLSQLLEAILNNKAIEIYSGTKKDAVLDKEATDAANVTAEELRNDFNEWLWSDKEREARLVRYYNDNYNNTVNREYDGSHLNPNAHGMNSKIMLKPHQKNVVWRMLQKGNTLIAHCVGAGKTFEMQTAGMEMRRLGIANKPMYCLPNNVVEQFAREFRQLYPEAKLLVLQTKDLPAVPKTMEKTKTPDGRTVTTEKKLSAKDKERVIKARAERNRTLARVRTEDWDGIIISHDLFQRFPLSPETAADFIREQIDILERTIQEAHDNKMNTRTMASLENKKAALQDRLEDILNTNLDDIGIPFEALGIDQLFVDEADMFKNLHFATSMDRVSGLTNSDANRSNDMFAKTQWLTKAMGGRGVVFATGTPVSNTMAELYTMTRYLDMQGLKEKGLELFDNWIRTFSEIGSGIERRPDGNGYRKVNKVKRFINMAELNKMFRKFADVKTQDDLDLDIPKLKNDKATIIKLDADPEITHYIKEEVPKRVAKMKHAKKGEKGSDNMLALTGDLRKMSLNDDKIEACAEQIAKKYEETTDVKGAQLVFCDIGIPKAQKDTATDADAETFDGGEETENEGAYEKLIAALKRHGIPAKQIAFVQSAKNKEEMDALFQKVNEGDIRILIGSTQKMGAGTNCQKHLVALHDLDAPWRPRDLEQRHGRILRQGNSNEEVEIFNYVVQDSFDANMWEKLKNKAAIIAQAMSSDTTIRAVEDADLVTLSYAEVEGAATGNPLIKERLNLNNEVTKYAHAQTAFKRRQRDAENTVATHPEMIEEQKEIIGKIKSDIAARKDVSGNKFRMTLSGKTYTERAKAQATLEGVLEAYKKGVATTIGEIGGFKLNVYNDGKQAVLQLVGKRAYAVKTSSITGVENTLKAAPDNALKDHETAQRILEQQLSDAQETLKQENPYEEKLKEMTKRLAEIDREIEKSMTEEGKTAQAEVETDSEPVATEEEAAAATPQERETAQNEGGESAPQTQEGKTNHYDVGTDMLGSPYAKLKKDRSKYSHTELMNIPKDEEYNVKQTEPDGRKTFWNEKDRDAYVKAANSALNKESTPKTQTAEEFFKDHVIVGGVPEHFGSTTSQEGNFITGEYVHPTSKEKWSMADPIKNRMDWEIDDWNNAEGIAIQHNGEYSPFAKKFLFKNSDDRDAFVNETNKRISKEDVARQESNFTTGDFKHTKTGEMIPQAKLKEQIDNYKEISAIAKRHGGYYSRYSKSFLFKSEKDRDAFVREADTRLSGTKYSASGEMTEAERMRSEARELSRDEWTPKQKKIAEFGEQMGVPVVFIEADPRLHGYHEDGVTYLNVNSEVPIQNVFWHESFHWMRNNNPELYADMMERMQEIGVFPEEDIADYKKSIGRPELTNEEAIEEMLADAMMDAERRGDIMQNIARADKGLIERFVAWLRETMDAFQSFMKNPDAGLTRAKIAAMNNELSRFLQQVKDGEGNRIFRITPKGEVRRFNGAALPAVAYSANGGNNKKAVSIKENIANGKKAISTVLATKQDVLGAMYRKEVGDIDFVYGQEGDPNRNYAGGYGISKILAKHGEEAVRMIPEVIANGEVEDRYSDRKHFIYKDYIAVVKLNFDGVKRTWLVTNFQQYQNKKDSFSSEVYARSEPTPNSPNSTAGGNLSTSNVPQGESKVNEKETSNKTKYSVNLNRDRQNRTHQGGFLSVLRNKLAGIVGDGTMRVRKEMKDALERAAGVSIRAGHIDGMTNVKTAGGVIRTRNAYDWETILPEAGKMIAKRLGLKSTNEMGAYIGKWILDGAPNDTSQEAADFQKAMRQHPELQDQILDAHDIFQEWNNMDADKRIEASVQWTKRGTLERLLLGDTSIKDELAEAQKNWYDEWIEELGSLGRLEESIEKKTGKKIRGRDSALRAFRLLRGATGKFMTMIEGKDAQAVEAIKRLFPNVDFEGFKTIRMILDDAGVRQDKEGMRQFMTYCIAKHSMSIHKKNEDLELEQLNLERKLKQAKTEKEKAELRAQIVELGQQIMQAPNTRKDAGATIAKFAKRFGKAQQDLVRFSRVTMDIMVDSGLVSENRRDEMAKAWPDYVPFFRVFDENEDVQWGDSLKHVSGSKRDLVNPLESIIKNTFEFVRRAEKNKAKLKIANLAKMSDVGEYIQLVDAAKPDDKTVLDYYENGQKKFIQTDPTIVTAIRNMGLQSSTMFGRILRFPAQIARAAFTMINPSFAVRNVLRDSADAYLYSRYGYNPLKDFMRGFMHAIKQDEMYYEWLASGAAQASLISLDRDYTQSAINNITRTWQERLVHNPLDILQIAGEYSEYATRIGAYERAKNEIIKRDATISAMGAIAEAAFESRDLMDFSRGGKSSRAMNQLIIFSNASIQGWDKFFRTFDFRKDKKAFMAALARLAISAILPSIFLFMLNYDKDWWKEIPDWQKEKHWIIKVGDTILRIPKGQDPGVQFFSNFVEKGLASMYNNDPFNFNRQLRNLWKNTMPDMLPTTFMPFIEAYANYSFFTERNIVPQYQKKLPEKMQYGPHTSSFAKWLGEKIGVAPSHIDHIIAGYGGNLARGAFNVYDQFAGNQPLNTAKEEMPIISGLTIMPYKNPKSVQEYYEKLDEQEKLYNEFKMTHVRPDGYDPVLYGRMKKARTALQKLSKMERSLMNNPNVPLDERKARQEQIQARRIEIIKRVLGR